MLHAQHCDLFCQPFFQFAQLKQHCPERIEPLKAAYKSAWQDWRQTVLTLAADLGGEFAPPHIERWCNGWQVRAHFFAYFKYAVYRDSAAIVSLLLNRRRLTVSLDWHAYRAAQSSYALADFRQWYDAFAPEAFEGFEIWRGSDSEYADYACAAAYSRTQMHADADFFRIGRHLDKAQLAQTDVRQWLAESVQRLLPLYEACHRG